MSKWNVTGRPWRSQHCTGGTGCHKPYHSAFRKDTLHQSLHTRRACEETASAAIAQSFITGGPR
jgi:hypothetical protein